MPTFFWNARIALTVSVPVRPSMPSVLKPCSLSRRWISMTSFRSVAVGRVHADLLLERKDRLDRIGAGAAIDAVGLEALLIEPALDFHDFFPICSRRPGPCRPSFGTQGSP